jgi:hypothetical protein
MGARQIKVIKVIICAFTPIFCPPHMPGEVGRAPYRGDRGQRSAAVCGHAGKMHDASGCERGAGDPPCAVQRRHGHAAQASEGAQPARTAATTATQATTMQAATRQYGRPRWPGRHPRRRRQQRRRHSPSRTNGMTTHTARGRHGTVDGTQQNGRRRRHEGGTRQFVTDVTAGKLALVKPNYFKN